MIQPPLTYDDARTAARTLAKRRHEAGDNLVEAIKDAAEKKRLHRIARALAYVKTTDGTADLRKTRVEELASQAEYDRELAEGMVRACSERLAEVDGERASLHKLIEWSMKDPAGAER